MNNYSYEPVRSYCRGTLRQPELYIVSADRTRATSITLVGSSNTKFASLYEPPRVHAIREPTRASMYDHLRSTTRRGSRLWLPPSVWPRFKAQLHIMENDVN